MTEFVLRIRDLVDHRGIPDARVHAEPFASALHVTEDMPEEWRVDSPVDQEADVDGRVVLRLPSVQEEVRISARAFGYFPAKRIRFRLQNSSPSEEWVELSPLVVAGLWLRTGGDRPGRAPFGWLRTSHDGGSPLKPTGPPEEDESALKGFLAAKLAGDANVYWEFGSLRPEADSTVGSSLESDYSYCPFAGSDFIRGKLTYKRVRDFTESDLAVIDVSGEVSRRIARLEIEFDEVSDPKQLPRGSWVIQSRSDPLVIVQPPVEPTPRDGRLLYRIDVGSGPYRIGPPAGFMDVATFDPVEVDVQPGETRHLMIPLQPELNGDLSVLVLDAGGAIDTDHGRFTIRKSAGGPIVAVPFVGEARHLLVEGDYLVRVYVGDAASDPMAVTITRESRAQVTYRRTE